MLIDCATVSHRVNLWGACVYLCVRWDGKEGIGGPQLLWGPHASFGNPPKIQNCETSVTTKSSFIWWECLHSSAQFSIYDFICLYASGDDFLMILAGRMCLKCFWVTGELFWQILTLKYKGSFWEFAWQLVAVKTNKRNLSWDTAGDTNTLQNTYSYREFCLESCDEEFNAQGTNIYIILKIREFYWCQVCVTVCKTRRFLLHLTFKCVCKASMKTCCRWAACSHSQW